MSVLNQTFQTLYQTAPFSEIKASEFLSAFEKEIQKTKEEIDDIANSKEEPSFENTIAALDFAGKQLDRISSLFFNLNSAETNEEIQKLAQQISPMLTEFSNDVVLNQTLFLRVKKVYDADINSYTEEQQTLLEKKYKNFVRNGALLGSEEKDTLREIDRLLAKNKLQFGEHVLAETNAFQMHLSHESEVAGIPDMAREAAKALAEKEGKEGWVFTLDYPSYIPFMTYAENRDLRKKMHKAFGSKGFQDNENNNEKLVLEIAKLRYRRAQLLGYKTHAHFVLEERMAETPENVFEFLENLLKNALPAAKKEFETLESFAKDLDQIDRLEKWDGAYYSEKLKQKLFSLDSEKLKPYFPLDQVLKGAFAIANKLFDLSFEVTEKVDVYHDSVSTYLVKDANSELVAVFYADFHPRAGKRNGAWMTSYKPQYKEGTSNSRPHVSIVCNFTAPTETTPSLLSFNEVTTLFHEFGHALHGMLANTVYPSLSGTNVFWDFVELPSQLMENWCYEKEALKLFAYHYETAELIPQELIHKIKDAANFMEGMQTVRQLSFGLLDMAWHGVKPLSFEDVLTIETAAFESTNLYPSDEETCMSTAFSHIFQGGYSSGYYSYKWAEVLDADAFAYFKEKGVFHSEVAKKLKDTVLSKGGTIHPMKLYKMFRGEAPNNKALLKRAGLL